MVVGQCKIHSSAPQLVLWHSMVVVVVVVMAISPSEIGVGGDSEVEQATTCRSAHGHCVGIGGIHCLVRILQQGVRVVA